MSSSSSSKKIVLSKNKVSNSQASSSSQFSRSPTPQFPPLPPIQNRFAPLAPQQPRPRPPYSSIIKPLEAKSIVQASTSKPIIQASTSTPLPKTLPYILNPDRKIIKILEPIEVERVKQSFYALINFIYPQGSHFYVDDYKNREYYQSILIDTGSVEISHNCNKNDPKIAFSQVKILKVLTLEEWGSRPYISKVLSNFPSYPQYNYYDYQEAWEKTFLLRNFDHSWFFQFDNQFSNTYPKWFIHWFRFMGIRPEAFPKEISEAFSRFTTYFQQNGIPIFEYVLQFMSLFRIPWIFSWTYIFEEDNPSPPLLQRQYRFKWWNKFIIEKANVQAVDNYYKQLTTNYQDPPMQDSSLEDQEYIRRIQACTTQEEIQRILNEVRHSPSSSRKSDTEIFQDSQDPYEMMP